VREANRTYVHDVDEDFVLGTISDDARGWDWDGDYPPIFDVQYVERGGGYDESDPYVLITFNNEGRTKFKVRVEEVK
jgi:hypothetical protein